jgi:hypothetical protein
VCESAPPRVAPMINCATVPTTISGSAVATRSRIDISVATSARPSHNAACSQISVVTNPAGATRGYSSDATFGGSAESGLMTPKCAGIWA